MSSLCLQVLRAVAFITVVLGGSWTPAHAQAPEKKDVKVMMDWIIQGTHAPFFVAREKGYYKEAGLSAQIDAGKGATNVAVSVAGGVYDFGWVDMPSMIKFNAQNSALLEKVYVIEIVKGADGKMQRKSLDEFPGAGDLAGCTKSF